MRRVKKSMPSAKWHSVAIKIETQLDGHNALLLSARGAYLRRDWETSYEAFAHGESGGTRSATDDLDALATAAWRLGSVQGVASILRAGVQATLPTRSHGSGDEGCRHRAGLADPWRSQRRSGVDEPGASTAGRRTEKPATGYLAYLDAYLATCAGDADALQRQVGTLGRIRALDTPAMTSLCAVVEALAAIGEARMADAFGLIDEALLAVSPTRCPIEWAGDIYCLVLHHCNRVADLPACGRGRSRWSDGVRTSPPWCTAAYARCTGCTC